MKKILSSLPVRLIIGVVIGIIIGLGSADLWIGGTDVGGTIMQVVLTLKNLLGSLINFCVPLSSSALLPRLSPVCGAMPPGCWSWRWHWPIPPQYAPH